MRSAAPDLQQQAPSAVLSFNELTLVLHVRAVALEGRTRKPSLCRWLVRCSWLEGLVLGPHLRPRARAFRLTGEARP